MRIIVKLLLVMFVLGLVMATAAVLMGLNIQGLSDFFNDDESYGEEIVYVQNDLIDGIHLSSETRNVILSATEDDFITIRYYAQEKDTWTISETGGVLSIIQEQKTEFFRFINFKTASSEVRTIYIEVPETWVLDLTLKSNVGTMRLEFDDVVYHKALSIESNTGRVYLKKLNVDSVDIKLNTGSSSLIDVMIENDLVINTDTGTIHVDNVGVNDVAVKSSTGNIRLQNLTAFNVTANNDTGRITSENVLASGDLSYKTTTGRITMEKTTANSYDLRATTGDIIITVESLSEMKLDLKATIGKIMVAGANQGNSHVTSTGSVSITARVTTGNITINVQD
ncbi:DUF4097 family beta strand repeat-containing protein [Peloplasma aerotolerans]|uniref:DUF4097 family beta strand repeat-containing protein n=1 Tax=Peloplasma aerotolerans TaxID=3044389 RepID=A0AAW6U7L4_9MOLU|nr:DUF4097 family beta strand repeat-containing protein [Mariniplasma sp. M4Ah]MDI6452058.1 DUF4097 family beta strand repeat-containing protein [Mariniplasma sp. M4Ah]